MPPAPDKHRGSKREWTGPEQAKLVSENPEDTGVHMRTFNGMHTITARDCHMTHTLVHIGTITDTHHHSTGTVSGHTCLSAWGLSLIHTLSEQKDCHMTHTPAYMGSVTESLL